MLFLRPSCGMLAAVLAVSPAFASDVPIAVRVGRPPVPPGSRVLACPGAPDRIAVTLDRPASPTYLGAVRAMAEEAKRPVDPRDAAAGEPRPFAAEFERMREAWAREGAEAEDTVGEIAEALRRDGYAPIKSTGPSAWEKAPDTPRHVRVLVQMQAWKEQQACLRQGVAIPAGPILLFF